MVSLVERQSDCGTAAKRFIDDVLGGRLVDPVNYHVYFQQFAQSRDFLLAAPAPVRRHPLDIVLKFSVIFHVGLIELTIRLHVLDAPGSQFFVAVLVVVVLLCDGSEQAIAIAFDLLNF